MQSSNKCIHCDVKIASLHTELNDGSLIHNQCLTEIKLAIINPYTDKLLKETYEVILSLQKLICLNCKKQIDQHQFDISKPNGVSTYCNNCLENVQNPSSYNKNGTMICSLCNENIDKQSLQKGIKIDELIICITCYEGSLNVESKMIKKSKPKILQNSFGLKHSQSYKLISPLKGNRQFLQKNYLPFYFNQKKINSIEEENKMNKNNKSYNGMIKKECLPYKKKQQKLQDKIQIIKKQQSNKCSLCQMIPISVINFEGLILCQKCFDLNINFQKNNIHNNQKSYKRQNKQKNQQKCKKSKKWFQDVYSLADLFAQIPNQDNFKAYQITQQIKSININSYSEKECKICNNAQSVMINHNCRHIIMCQKCYKQIKIKFENKEQFPCPYCRINGPYSRYLAPIYI